jgi:hypothetical protein
MSDLDIDPFPVTMPFPITAPLARYDNVRCASLREFERLIEDLRPRDDKHVLVFRGQAREYQSDGAPGLMPATRRSQHRIKPFKLKLKGYSRFIADRMYDSEIALAERIRLAEALGLGTPTLPRVPWMHAYSVLVQHYCSGTNGIDVTFDPEIALWFSCHDARHISSGIRHRPITLKDIEAGLAPVVYVIECLRPEWGRRLPDSTTLYFAPDLSDLRNLMFEADVRPNRQQSGILLASAVEGSHANAALSFVVVRAELSTKCVTQALGRTKYSESYLFPSPREDYLYRWLLSSKSERRVYRLARHARYTPEVCAELMRR